MIIGDETIFDIIEANAKICNVKLHLANPNDIFLYAMFQACCEHDGFIYEDFLKEANTHKN